MGWEHASAPGHRVADDPQGTLREHWDPTTKRPGTKDEETTMEMNEVKDTFGVGSSINGQD